MRVLLAALYLPGLVRPVAPSTRTGPKVFSSLQGGPDGLRRAGFFAEATLLDDPKLLDSAARASILTFADPEYPEGWRRLDRPPMALWTAGDPVPAGRWTGGVGSRDVSEEAKRWCREVGARCGTPIVSGGAAGCDLAFAEEASRTIHILPTGLPTFPAVPDGVTLLSPFAPGEEFMSAQAMARNRLIYAAAEVTAIGHVRFREGGTWHGALTACRESHAVLIVRDDPEDRGARALVACGATPLANPADFAGARRRALDRKDGLFAGAGGTL